MAPGRLLALGALAGGVALIGLGSAELGGSGDPPAETFIAARAEILRSEVHDALPDEAQPDGAPRYFAFLELVYEVEAGQDRPVRVITNNAEIAPRVTDRAEAEASAAAAAVGARMLVHYRAADPISGDFVMEPPELDDAARRPKALAMLIGGALLALAAFAGLRRFPRGPPPIFTAAPPPAPASEPDSAPEAR